jgi:hypothetical protein
MVLLQRSRLSIGCIPRRVGNAVKLLGTDDASHKNGNALGNTLNYEKCLCGENRTLSIVVFTDVHCFRLRLPEL